MGNAIYKIVIRENVHNAQLAARERERARERQSRESRVCSDIKLLESALLSSALFTSQPPTSSLCTESRERERERERASERERESELSVSFSLSELALELHISHLSALI